MVIFSRLVVYTALNSYNVFSQWGKVSTLKSVSSAQINYPTTLHYHVPGNLHNIISIKVKK